VNTRRKTDIIRVIKLRRMTGHVTCIGRKRSACEVLVVELEVRGPFGKPGYRWDSIKLKK
jgi:hypothetical protein